MKPKHISTPSSELEQSRQQFLHKLNKQAKKASEISDLVAYFEGIWSGKITTAFPFQKDDPELVIIWGSYLDHFTPQLLEQAIDLLATRLKQFEARYGSVLPQPQHNPTTDEIYSSSDREKIKWRINAACGVQSVRGYFRSLVHELREAELEAHPIERQYSSKIMLHVLEEAEGQTIVFQIPASTYDDANLHYPKEHRELALDLGWIAGEHPGKLTIGGRSALRRLKGGVELDKLRAWHRYHYNVVGMARMDVLHLPARASAGQHLQWLEDDPVFGIKRGDDYEITTVSDQAKGDVPVFDITLSGTIHVRYLGVNPVTTISLT